LIGLGVDHNPSDDNAEDWMVSALVSRLGTMPMVLPDRRDLELTS
jgi:hypothetical protein